VVPGVGRGRGSAGDSLIKQDGADEGDGRNLVDGDDVHVGHVPKCFSSSSSGSTRVLGDGGGERRDFHHARCGYSLWRCGVAGSNQHWAVSVGSGRRQVPGQPCRSSKYYET
jgi:hypothetical protein